MKFRIRVMNLKFSVQAKIKKPVEEVFDAVYNPDKLNKYFTTDGANGPLDEGKEITWSYHDSPDPIPIYVIQSVKNQKIVFEWVSEAEMGSRITQEIHFEQLENNTTLIKISQNGWKNETQKSLEESYNSCIGWTQMLCSLKVYLEYGKNLRKFFY